MSEEDREYSFSENFNAAINLVKTERMVLVHNDMYFPKDFFRELDTAISAVGDRGLVLYSTVEPLKNLYHPRPGKIVLDFGSTFPSFKIEEFETFAEKASASAPLLGPEGYGFYLGGKTELFREVGGFDKDTFIPAFCEDDDMVIRIKSRGIGIKVAPRAICYHFGSQTSRDFEHQGMSDLEVRSNRRFCRKWGFEVCSLWTFGVLQTSKPLRIRDVRIGLAVDRGVLPDEIFNLEPLFDLISYEPTETELQVHLHSESPLPSENIGSKFGFKKDVDVLIRNSGRHLDMQVLPKLVAALRIPGLTPDYVEGQSFWASDKVAVTVFRNLAGLPMRVDTKSYL